VSQLHRQLLASFLAEIEPIALKTLETAATLVAPAAAPLIDVALEAGDALVHPMIAAGAASVSPFPAPQSVPAPVASSVPPAEIAGAGQVEAAAAAPTVADVVAALQATLAQFAK
jgi:hypothetical protein